MINRSIVFYLLLLAPDLAQAEPVLPYSLRTHEYSAWDTTVRGDLGTVGMAGATVGLGDTRIGSVDNPAGLGMTLDSTGIEITGSSIQDGYIQAYPSLITTGSTVVSFLPVSVGRELSDLVASKRGRYLQGRWHG